MPDYRRNWVPGGTYFFTVNFLERKRDLLVTEIDLLRDSVRRVKRLYPFEIVAWVVLPDHMHCIWTLPPDDADYAKRWRLIKLLFSKGLPKQERLSSARKKRNERGVYPRGTSGNADFGSIRSIRDDDDYRRHIEYIHWNPMKHGLVKQVSDWPYSSFHRYVNHGIYPKNWAGGLESEAPIAEQE